MQKYIPSENIIEHRKSMTTWQIGQQTILFWFVRYMTLSTKAEYLSSTEHLNKVTLAKTSIAWFVDMKSTRIAL